MEDSEKFILSSYEEFDKCARDVVRKWIDSKGFYSLSVEDYGADIKVAKIVGNTHVLTRHELEVRPCWIDEAFPYSTVTIPKRKEKLFSQGVDDLFFWSLSSDYKLGMFVCANIVCQCPIIRKHSTRGDGDFFSVHIMHYVGVRF